MITRIGSILTLRDCIIKNIKQINRKVIFMSFFSFSSSFFYLKKKKKKNGTLNFFDKVFILNIKEVYFTNFLKLHITWCMRVWEKSKRTFHPNWVFRLCRRRILFCWHTTFYMNLFKFKDDMIYTKNETKWSR